MSSRHLEREFLDGLGDSRYAVAAQRTCTGLATEPPFRRLSGNIGYGDLDR